MLVAANWSSYQSYKDRKPPWIRLHKSLLDNYEFQSMSSEARALLPMLWLLASEDTDPTSGIIKDSIEKISFRLRIPEGNISQALNEIVKAGFFHIDQPCSETVTISLQDCNPGVTPETETETDKPLSSVDDCPHEKIIELYHEHCPTLSSVQVWNEKRKRWLKARWREDKKRQDLDWWKGYFQYVSGCPFLMGSDGKWQATLEWLINESNMIKVIEGNYESQGVGNE